jgi:hypothetical protein
MRTGASSPRRVPGSTVHVVAGWLAVFAAAFLGAGCLTTPPADLPATPMHRPTILHDAVSPPDDQLLVEWPPDDTFVVPVQLDDPNEAFRYDVFVDYNGSSTALPSYVGAGQGQAGIDGGIVTVPIPLQPPPPVDSCHRVQVLVVHDFAMANGAPLFHTPDMVGGDSVVWFYTPSGGLDGCATYDAGPFQDGASPAPVGAGDGGQL